MRLPKTVNISGKTYTIAKNKKKWSSRGQTANRQIVIGTKWNSDEHELDSFLHEVFELVCCERHTHYMAGDDNVRIVMSHREFTDVITDVAVAIRPMIKE